MDKRELAIIASLRQNCRKSLTDMSRETNIPVSTLHEKIHSYSRSLIKKHTALVDFGKLGYNTKAKVMLKADKAERQKLQDFLTASKHVNTLLKVNNGFDFMAEMVFEHIKDMEDFLEIIEQKFRITNKETFYVIDELKQEDFLASPALVSLNAV